MDARFTHNFRDKDVARQCWISLLSWLTFFSVWISFNVFEYIESQSFVFMEDLVYQELMILSGVLEEQDLLR